MKANQFKLLCDLPEGYEYDLIRIDNKNAVIGKRDRDIIAFYILENCLEPITFKMSEDHGMD